MMRKLSIIATGTIILFALYIAGSTVYVVYDTARKCRGFGYDSADVDFYTGKVTCTREVRVPIENAAAEYLGNAWAD